MGTGAAREADRKTPGSSRPSHAQQPRGHPGPGPQSRFAESIGIKIVPIPRGGVLDGVVARAGRADLKLFPVLTKEELADEQPRHRVRVTKLQGLSAHEVTVGQFRRFVDETGYKTEAERDGEGRVRFRFREEIIRAGPEVHLADPGVRAVGRSPGGGGVLERRDGVLRAG